jgi:hypothetical protein
VSHVPNFGVSFGHVGGLSPDTSRVDVAQLQKKCNKLSTDWLPTGLLGGGR